MIFMYGVDYTNVEDLTRAKLEVRQAVMSAISTLKNTYMVLKRHVLETLE